MDVQEVSFPDIAGHPQPEISFLLSVLEDSQPVSQLLTPHEPQPGSCHLHEWELVVCKRVKCYVHLTYPNLALSDWSTEKTDLNICHSTHWEHVLDKH